MYSFCTYFDHHFLPRGLALYTSLQRHCPAFELWVLCMDRASYDFLNQAGLPEIYPIALEDFERGDERLLEAKGNRTLVEYYFTCTPSLPLYILSHYADVNLITYLDADLFFFADPTPIYDEIGDGSIGIIPHRFPSHLRHLEQNGIYNVGWLSFRRDERGVGCLRWWRERCIEWCYDQVGDGRFADQKYLDKWPALFSGVRVVEHKGADLAPWNLANYDFYHDERGVWVDGQPLIFFHFHGLEQIKDWLYDSNFEKYSARLSAIVLQHIYAPYIGALTSSIPHNAPPAAKGAALPRLRDVKFRRRLKHIVKSLIAQQYILVTNGAVRSI
jgi:hypothetical protein